MQGLSFSDVMFVTKQHMANAVASVSKQLEQVSDALAVCFIQGFLLIKKKKVKFEICNHMSLFFRQQKDTLPRDLKTWMERLMNSMKFPKL